MCTSANVLKCLHCRRCPAAIARCRTLCSCSDVEARKVHDVCLVDGYGLGVRPRFLCCCHAVRQRVTCDARSTVSSVIALLGKALRSHCIVAFSSTHSGCVCQFRSYILRTQHAAKLGVFTIVSVLLYWCHSCDDMSPTDKSRCSRQKHAKVCRA